MLKEKIQLLLMGNNIGDMMRQLNRILQIHAVDHCNNRCMDCNHYSIYANKHEYDAGEYFEALDVVYEKCWYPGYLVVIGGEPFLHSDLMRFCKKLHERYAKAKLSITTNGFWITKKNLIKHERLFSMLSRIIVTVYPNLYKKINEAIPVDHLPRYITALYPHLTVIVRDHSKGMGFMRANYSPEVPSGFYPRCGEVACNSLLPDGRLTRCSTAAYGPQFNSRLKFFNNYKDVYFNVFEWKEDLMQWLSKIPYDACSECPFVDPLLSKWKIDNTLASKDEWAEEAMEKMSIMKYK